MLRAAFALTLAVALTASPDAQPLVRTPATSLRLPAQPPATSYSTARAYPSLSFTQPVALVTPPGESQRLFVVEKPGRIWVIPDVTAATPTRILFLDLTPRVTVSGNSNDERGLLALAFHPDFAANREFFVWYTTSTTTAAGAGLHDRLSRFRMSAADPNAADPASEEPLLTQRDQANNHNGGELLFGPDGYLYLSLGDEGGANDQYQNAQKIDQDFFAGILRLDVDRRPGSLAPAPHPAVHAGTYAIPPDNPFVAVANGPVRTEFWAIGLRNPWRMAFDPATGRLWCADVGQGSREEINVITRGGNYGWPYREGRIAGPRGNPPAGAVYDEPVWDYGRGDGISVTGGIVYRGSKYAALHGRYLFGDFVSGRIWALDPDGASPVGPDRVQLLATDDGIASFGVDPATGDILIADHLEDTIKRLVATTTSGGAPFPETLSATGAFADAGSLTPAPGLVAYEPNVSFWSDHARKRRWFALPDATSQFTADAGENWRHPTGAVWVKHFDLELTRGDPASARRIETRFLVKTADGVYGLTYRWNDAQSDATLVPDEGADQNFIVVENGVARTQTWRFPSRAECLMCHTAAGGHALSFNTRQLNRSHDFSGGTANQLDALVQAGYLSAPATFAPAALPALARADDSTTPLEHRARSYVDVNCSQCHQPGGTALGSWDARATTPLALANLVHGALVDSAGDPANRVIVPGDPVHSQLLARMSIRGAARMPPVGTNERDLAGESLLRDWILALAKAPPAPSGGRVVNLAARSSVDAAGPLIAGFVVGLGAGKRVLIRGIGPTLGTAFGVANALPEAALTVFGPNSTTRVAASNSGWFAGRPSPGIAELSSAFAAVGAFPLPPGSADAALVAQLEPGSYTAHVNANAGTGIALVELYDLDAADSSASTPPSRLVNLAVRAHVGVGDNILIPGVTIGPGASQTVLIRAVGPGLGPLGVTDALSAPSLALLSGTQALHTNTRWATAPNAGEIPSIGTQVGAFALAEADSAILTTLSPGSYTIQVSGANNTTGVALVEVYAVP